MAKAIFYHRPDSNYNDVPSIHYQFPRMYLSRIQQTIGDQIIYYGPLHKHPSRYYWAVAQVERIEQDPHKDNSYYAIINDYLDFDVPVNYRDNGGYESKLVNPDGSINSGTSQNAVRIITPLEFTKIIDAGLAEKTQWPDRDEAAPDELHDYPGWEESPQADFERPIREVFMNRKFRDEKFKLHIRKAYDRTCAFTGLRLINGKGRPEVEAAHIMPVEKNGPDWIRNGIALSGTVHWMFDRGLLSLDDNFSILKSRQLNHDVSNLLVKDMKARVPEDPSLQPHPYFLDWHRNNIFKN